MSEPLQMRSSSKNSNKEPGMPEIPQFVCAMYLDENGEQKFTYNIRGGFPKDKILPGLVEIATDLKKNLLDRIVPGPDQDEAMERLRSMAEDGQIPPETAQDEPVRDNILYMGTQPTDEN